MTDKDASVDPCSDISGRISEAQELLVRATSKESTMAALERAESLQEAIAETHLFFTECREREEMENDEINGFRRDLYGRRRI